MKLKTFIAFAGITLTAAAAAMFAVSGRNVAPPADPGAGQPLIPGLAQRINQVTVLVVGTASQTATFVRPDPETDRWTLVEKSGYAADTDLVRRVIVSLALSRTVESRTSKPEQYARLALSDDTATTVTLRCADGQDLPGLFIGKTVTAATAEREGTFYVRRSGDAMAWMAEGRLPPLTTDPMQWLPRDLPSLPRARVASVTVSRPNGDDIAISRKDPALSDFTVSGLPRNAKLKQAKINELAGASEFLAFEDVAPLEPNAPPPAVVTTLRSFEGEVLTIRISRRDGRSWVNFAASSEGKATSPEAEQRIKDAQAKYDGWSYRLSDAAVKDLAPSSDDLMEIGAGVSGPGGGQGRRP